MSRSSQSQLSGHEEAARFDRENRLPHSSSLYQQRRLERYPDTPSNELPQETLPSKEVYKDRQRENDHAKNRYKSTRRREEGIVDGYEEDQRGYYKASSGGIRPSGHRDLEPLAGRLAEAEFRSVEFPCLVEIIKGMPVMPEHEKILRRNIPIWTPI